MRTKRVEWNSISSEVILQSKGEITSFKDKIGGFHYQKSYPEINALKGSSGSKKMKKVQKLGYTFKKRKALEKE